MAQWVFKHSEEFLNRRHFPSMTAICRFSNILQRLSLPRIIDQFGHKKCQKKRKDVTYKLQKKCSQKYLLYMSNQLSKIRSVHTYAIIPWTVVYFGWICSLSLRKINATAPSKLLSCVRFTIYIPICDVNLYGQIWIVLITRWLRISLKEFRRWF